MENGKSGISIKIFADGADIDAMKAAYRGGIVKGFTTNPTLMRKAGLADYEAFARAALAEITDLPISFEVFSDDFDEMERQARLIDNWGSNVYIKIPITNTKGESSVPLIKKLSNDGLSLNITAMLTLAQVSAVSEVLPEGVKSIVSVFAGRIADTGRDPMPIMREAASILGSKPDAELLWASSRELLNIFQAQDSGSDIITVTDDILKKLNMIGKDLAELSLETVNMFYKDAQSAGFSL